MYTNISVKLWHIQYLSLIKWNSSTLLPSDRLFDTVFRILTSPKTKNKWKYTEILRTKTSHKQFIIYLLLHVVLVVNKLIRGKGRVWQLCVMHTTKNIWLARSRSRKFKKGGPSPPPSNSPPPNENFTFRDMQHTAVWAYSWCKVKNISEDRIKQHFIKRFSKQNHTGSGKTFWK